jgi:predicted phage terminase large subunit-like protein
MENTRGVEVISFAVNEYEMIASVTRRSYYEFLQEFWDTFVPEEPVWNWHIELICNELQALAERIFLNKPKLYDLIINISPGTTKSSAASIALLPWMWTRMPTCRSINASHTQDLVFELSRKSREIVYSEKYQKCFPEVHLIDDQNTKGHFVNNKGGSRYSCTVGGKNPMGMHAHIHVVDDPIDPQQAISEASIDTANTFITDTLSTRKINKSACPLVLIMQRLAQEDPSGYLLAMKNRRIRHICLPAELTDDVKPVELRQKYVDGLMDPVRLNRQVLDEYRDNGDYMYSGQFLQNPIPLGGGMFKCDNLRFHEGEEPGFWYFKKLVRYWDNAGTPGARKTAIERRRAWTVGVLMGLHKDGSFWVLDVVRGRFRADERERKKLETAQSDEKKYRGHVRIVQEQEGGSGGQEQAFDTARTLAGYSIMLDKPRGDKELRSDPFARQVNIGNVYVLKAPWNMQYIEEMKHYPHSTFKDQMDASAGAFNCIFKLRRRVGAF